MDDRFKVYDWDEEYGAGAARVMREARGLRSRRTSAVAKVNRERDVALQADDPLLGFAPYQHKQLRRNSISPERQRKFIAALAASGIVTQAARTIGVSLEALYRLRHQPGAEDFSRAWDEAIDRGMARLEDCALERALAGEERLIVRDGQVVARWRKHDTALLMFLLRQRRSARYVPEQNQQLKPGHPEYERLHRLWAQKEYEDEEEILARIKEKLAAMRSNEAEARRLLDGPAGDAGFDEGPLD